MTLCYICKFSLFFLLQYNRSKDSSNNNNNNDRYYESVDCYILYLFREILSLENIERE